MSSMVVKQVFIAYYVVLKKVLESLNFHVLTLLFHS